VEQQQYLVDEQPDPESDFSRAARCRRGWRRLRDVKTGEIVRVTALRSDGVPYRWWDTLVEEASADYVVTYSPPGCVVYQPDGNGWISRNHIRAHYWADRWNVLLEVYYPGGQPLELYVHIAAPPRFTEQGIAYADHELDVVMPFGKPTEVVDEDEFTVAIARYGYTTVFQAQCRAAVQEAVRLVEGWTWSPLDSVALPKRSEPVPSS
jgi:protein associated with RNAse G/E